MIQICAFCFISFFVGKFSKVILKKNQQTCLKAIYLAQGNGVHSPWLAEDVFLGREKLGESSESKTWLMLHLNLLVNDWRSPSHKLQRFPGWLAGNR